MPLTNEQEKGLIVLKNRIIKKEEVSILQGYAGTGKTFLLSHLIDSINFNPEQVHFCAFTGTAAKLLMDKGLTASTIHKLIYKPIIKYGQVVGFTKKMREELSNIKLIVVDEYSMVAENLLKDLMSYEIPILLVGDPEQLPPIGKANKFMNSYHVILTNVMRQALDSPVLWAATKIREGEILKEGTYGESLFVGRKHELDERWLRKDVQFLCGTNNTREKLNTKISGTIGPVVGDKIIFLKNDWEAGIVNGSITHLKNINKTWDKYVLDFNYDGNFYKEYKSYYKNFPENYRMRKHMPKNAFDKAYAITVHKAQGQTIDSPMVIVDESFMFRENQKNHLYTALTRSSGKSPVALLR